MVDTFGFDVEAAVDAAADLAEKVGKLIVDECKTMEPHLRTVTATITIAILKGKFDAIDAKMPPEVRKLTEIASNIVSKAHG